MLVSAAYEQSVLTVCVSLLSATAYILLLLPKLFYSKPKGAPAPLPPPPPDPSLYSAFRGLVHARETCDTNITLVNPTNVVKLLCWQLFRLLPFQLSEIHRYKEHSSHTGTYKKSINTTKLEHRFTKFNTQISLIMIKFPYKPSSTK